MPRGGVAVLSFGSVRAGVGARARAQRMRARALDCYSDEMPGTNPGRLEVTPPLIVMDTQPGAFWFGAWGNINVLVWFKAPDLDGVKRLDATNPERVRAHPEKLSTVYIATATAGPPESDARTALIDMH
jgi:hypothetical protein